MLRIHLKYNEYRKNSMDIIKALGVVKNTAISAWIISKILKKIMGDFKPFPLPGKTL